MIPQSLYDSIRQHGEQQYPKECCGVLLGNSGNNINSILHVIPTNNTRTDSPQNRYQIDPIELIRIQKRGREVGLEIIGFYHSHPDHPAKPSLTDLDEAHWIGCSYLITSVETGKATATASFLLIGRNEREKRFSAEPILIRAERNQH
jgi:proteasome lid subunit RPN8/RPN11